MKALTLTVVFLCLLFAACSPDPASIPNPHDSKYETVEVDGATCVRDSQTGLLWQTKTAEPGLHNADNTYTWFHPHETNDELDYRGVEDGGVCDGSACDAWHYVQAVNAEGLCGYNDWRMPNKDEIYSISDIRRAATPPTINTRFFPNARPAEYWTGNDYSFQYDAAWAWNFELGHDRVDWKKEAKFIRLVRGTPGELDSVKE